MSYGKAVRDEAFGVAFLMNGGPATVYGARAFAAFREFYEQRSACLPCG